MQNGVRQVRARDGSMRAAFDTAFKRAPKCGALCQASEPAVIEPVRFTVAKTDR
jgi:hypothetical protein